MIDDDFDDFDGPEVEFDDESPFDTDEGDIDWDNIDWDDVAEVYADAFDVFEWFSEMS